MYGSDDIDDDETHDAMQPSGKRARISGGLEYLLSNRLQNGEYYMIDMTRARKGIQIARFVGGLDYYSGDRNTSRLKFDFFDVPHTFPSLPDFEIDEYYRNNPSGSELFDPGIEEIDRIYIPNPSNPYTFIRTDEIDNIQKVDLNYFFEELNDKISRMQPGKMYYVIAKTKFDHPVQHNATCLSKIKFISNLVRSEEYSFGTAKIIEMFFENGYSTENALNDIIAVEEVDLGRSGLPEDIIEKIEGYFGGKSKRKGKSKKMNRHKNKSRKKRGRKSRSSRKS
jgi:hypothetical protein